MEVMNDQSVNDLRVSRIGDEIESLISISSGIPKKKTQSMTYEDVVEALCMLRTYLKYNMFDLESCRREMAFLRDLIKKLEGGG